MKNKLLSFMCFLALNVYSQEAEKKFEKSFDFILHTQSRFNAMMGDREFAGAGDASGGKFTNGAKFSVHQLRLDAKGTLSESLFYRLRYRLSGGRVGTTTDWEVTSKAVDFGFIGYKFNDSFTGMIGKMGIPCGGFELDANPILVYEYSDMVEGTDYFLAGFDLGYYFGNQEFRINVSNSRTRTLQSQYGNTLNYDEISPSKFPLIATFNWNGNFFDGGFTPRYSFSVGEEAECMYAYFLALGSQFQVNKFRFYIDYYGAFEEIDRKGFLLGNAVDENYAYYHLLGGEVAKNVLYSSFVSKLEFRSTEYLNFFVKGMYETAYHKDVRENRLSDDELYRTSLGYFAGIEIYPNKDENLHFFLTYVGRSYLYNESLINDYDVQNLNTHKILLGAIWAIPMYSTKF